MPSYAGFAHEDNDEDGGKFGFVRWDYVDLAREHGTVYGDAKSPEDLRAGDNPQQLFLFERSALMRYKTPAKPPTGGNMFEEIADGFVDWVVEWLYPHLSEYAAADTSPESVEKHTPGGHDHDQSTHGRRGGRSSDDSSHRSAASASAQLLREHGGFTYQPVAGLSPTEGYVVSPFPDDSLIIDASVDNQELEDILTDYILSKASAFTDPSVHLGGWHDKQNDKIFFDLSVVVTDEAEARRMSETYNQLAYYDLSTGTEHRIEGTTGGLDKAHRHVVASPRRHRRIASA